MARLYASRQVRIVTVVSTVLTVLLGMASLHLASAVAQSSLTRDGESFRSAATTKVLSSNGDEIATLHGEVNREPVKLRDIPGPLQHAVIAIEDRRFYDHRGIDPRGVVRALYENARGSRQGASTISEQLAKNLYFHGAPRTISRKAAEALMTVGLEGLSSKKQILEAYLNTVYFGRGVYGVETASQSYFHKDVRKITLAESAFLAGLIHMPARYDWIITDTPAEQQQRRADAMKRRSVVLDAMADVGFISRRAADAASREKTTIYAPADPRWQHPYFIDAVLRELGVFRNHTEKRPDERFDFLGSTYKERSEAVYRSGLRIYTTLDERAQAESERALAQQLPPDELRKLSAAVVSVQPGTGYVRALIGGRNYYPDGCDDEKKAEQNQVCRYAKVNLALGRIAGGSGRQPGSSFKPVVLAAALEDGMSLLQHVDGSPFSVKLPVGEWKVDNYESGEGGDMSVVDAMVHSVNGAYARVEVQALGNGKPLAGAKKVAAMARRLGIPFPTRAHLKKTCGDRYEQGGDCTPAESVPAIALGAKEVAPIDMAAAYATFANDGVYTKPTTIEKIVDSDGKVLYEAKPQRHRAMSAATARGVSYVLQQVVERGTGTAAGLPRPVAGKTGTSESWRDAWFNGYVPQLATAVWVGNPVPVEDWDGTWSLESMTPGNGYPFQVVGGTFPARIWSAYMAEATSKLPVRAFPEAPEELFHPPRKLPDIEGKTGLPQSGDAVSLANALRWSGRTVRVVSQCPPGGGGGGLQAWKTEESGGVTTIYRSRAVC
jgi:penicillin-binding protein 1A